MSDNPETFGFQLRQGSRHWLTCGFKDEIWGLNMRTGNRQPLMRPAVEAAWSPDGRHLVARAWWEQGPPQGPFPGHLILVDTAWQRTSAPVLEACGGPPGPWSPDGRWLLVRVPEPAAGTKVCLYKFAAGQLRFIGLPPAAALPWSLKAWPVAAWLPNSQGFVWCAEGGLYRTSLADSTTVQLRATCRRIIYEGVSVARDGRRMIVQRTDQRIHPDSSRRLLAINLWTMNLDGSNERKMVFRGSHQRK